MTTIYTASLPVKVRAPKLCPLTRSCKPCCAALTLPLGLLLFWAGSSATALAAASAWLDHDHAKVRLISATESIGASQDVRLGLQFQLEQGWKIYWRSPGDAGFPPSLSWDRSRNLSGSEMLWPVPHRFSLFGLETFGYSDEVVLADRGAPNPAKQSCALPS